jgi:hypothetical protein
MRKGWRTLLVVAAGGAVACGSEVVVDDVTASSSSATAGAGGAVSSASTTATGSTSSSNGSGGAGGAGGAPPLVEQKACFWPGGLDHILVMQRDVAQGVCIWLFADWPTAPGQYAVQANNDWGVNQIVLSTDLANCLDDEAPIGANGTPADAATGTMTVPMPPPYPPTSLDLSVQITFSGLPPSLSPTHTIEATALPMGPCFSP